MSEINVKEINANHTKAMEFAQIAYSKEMHGDMEGALGFYEQALQFEKDAALALLQHVDKEPTRSVLFRSAASLAKKCNLIDDARKLILLGLNGNPPDFVRDELIQLQKSLQFIQKDTKAEDSFRLAARTKSKLTKTELDEIKKRFKKDE